MAHSIHTNLATPWEKYVNIINKVSESQTEKQINADLFFSDLNTLQFQSNVEE